MTPYRATEIDFADHEEAAFYERMCRQAAYLWGDPGENVEYEFGQTDLICAVIGWAEFPLDHKDVNAHIVEITKILYS